MRLSGQNTTSYGVSVRRAPVVTGLVWASPKVPSAVPVDENLSMPLVVATYSVPPFHTRPYGEPDVVAHDALIGEPVAPLYLRIVLATLSDT